MPSGGASTPSAMRHPNGRAALAGRFGQPIIACVAIDLQNAIEAGEEGFGILPRAAGGIEVDHAGRVLAAPGSVIAGERPEVSRLCRPAPRVQHRGRRFVHEQLAGPFENRCVKDGIVDVALSADTGCFISRAARNFQEAAVGLR